MSTKEQKKVKKMRNAQRSLKRILESLQPYMPTAEIAAIPDTKEWKLTENRYAIPQPKKNLLEMML